MAPKQIYGHEQYLHSMIPNMVLWELCENVQLGSWPTVFSIHVAYLPRSIVIFSHQLLGLASVWFTRGFLTKILYMFDVSLILTICTALCNIHDLTTLITEVLSVTVKSTLSDQERTVVECWVCSTMTNFSNFFMVCLSCQFECFGYFIYHCHWRMVG
jgi:hypothetical protein